ncbi:MAG TPA: DUF523 domain-containing protein [Clostridiaceae bacterium]|nr:DUF523 domain-containing protein [Clostridiaceae bacterium]
MILVSACLCGTNCKYSGGNNLSGEVLRLLAEGKAIPVCPEQLGGLTTPRPTAEISGGTGADVLEGSAKVLTSSGADVTDNFTRGAREVLSIAKAAGAKEAILKAKSPSCGCGRIYDGTFSGKLVEGNGVTAELLIRNGIMVKTV